MSASLSVSSFGSSQLQPPGYIIGEPPIINFQYPRSDRANCNLLVKRRPVFTLPDFQYPRSDRANCNLLFRSQLFLNSKLSVSSFGSSQLQPTADAGVRLDAIFFQYPRSDRANCNHWRAAKRRAGIQLSVSSFGSSQLQHHPQRDCVYEEIPFSILVRIEPTATLVNALYALSELGFQYPRSDRANCNDVARAAWVAQGMDFQYPRSDRANCNAR